MTPEILHSLLLGAVVTLEVTALGAALACAISFLVGLARLSRLAPIRIVAAIYVEVLRGVSTIVVLFWFFFALPFFGVSLSALEAGVLALGLTYGAYGAEVVRGAILHVARGQWEATVALNMTRRQQLQHVILPQAVLAMLPPLGNLLVDLLKATSLVSLITLSDLTFHGRLLQNSIGHPTEVYAFILAFYFVINFALSSGVRGLEAAVPGPGRRPGGSGGEDAGDMTWDFSFALQVLPTIAQGRGLTVLITLVGTVIAMILGLALAVLRRLCVRPVALLASAFVEFVRDTPLLVQVYFLDFVVMPAMGLNLDALVTGILAIGINYSAYTAEVYRAGIEAVPRGQWEASRALNLSAAHTWIAVILPQAVPKVIPALGNYLIAMFKDTPILSSIGVLEMLERAQILGSQTFRYLEPMTEVGLLFLLLSYPSSLVVRRLEARYGRVH